MNNINTTEWQEKIYSAVEDDSWQIGDERAIFKSSADVPKIMPVQYQANAARKVNECLFVFDHFFEEELFKRLTETARLIAKKTLGWSRMIEVDSVEQRLYPAAQQLEKDRRLSQNERDEIDSTMEAVIKKVHETISVLTYENQIVRYNSWINTGSIPLNGNQNNDFHFWHYDSDEYLEFCHPKNWVRFPVWGAIIYINQPKDEQHFTIFDDKTINQKIRAVSNRLAIFDPSYLHKVVGPNKSDDSKDTRTVMVMNAWDYKAPDHAIHIQEQYGVSQ
ncbi:MAG TPA: hypothetical protein EYP59_13055 [Thiotrichaceae bacterium]|nr:hypothetical protein [Thiotrichaceae bacterium]